MVAIGIASTTVTNATIVEFINLWPRKKGGSKTVPKFSSVGVKNSFSWNTSM